VLTLLHAEVPAYSVDGAFFLSDIVWVDHLRLVSIMTRQRFCSTCLMTVFLYGC